MKKLRLVAVMMFCAIAAALGARDADMILIVNGYFFKEIPAEVKSYKSDMRYMFVSTPEGTKALGISVPVTLSEEALEYALPADSVPEGAELLRRFREAEANNKGNSISFAPAKPLVKVGDEFPSFSATDIDGRQWTNADVAGKVMVLNLWFTGCGPCRAEMPELSEWKNEMPDVMFFSSTYEAPEIARQVLDKVNFNWIPLVNDTQFKELIGTQGYPLTIVVGRDGKIAAFEYGTSPEQRARLKQAIQSLR